MYDDGSNSFFTLGIGLRGPLLVAVHCLKPLLRPSHSPSALPPQEALSMQVLLPFLSIFPFRKSGLGFPTMLLHDLLGSPQPRGAEVAKCETWGLAWFPCATSLSIILQHLASIPWTTPSACIIYSRSN